MRCGAAEAVEQLDGRQGANGLEVRAARESGAACQRVTGGVDQAAPSSPFSPAAMYSAYGPMFLPFRDDFSVRCTGGPQLGVPAHQDGQAYGSPPEPR